MTTTASEKQVGGDHYKAMKIQPAEFIHANGIGFHEGCAIKYLSRWRKKNGIEDLRKAIHFIELLIEFESPTTEPVNAAAKEADDAAEYERCRREYVAEQPFLRTFEAADRWDYEPYTAAKYPASSYSADFRRKYPAAAEWKRKQLDAAAAAATGGR